jgi:hypothetical protein
VAGWQTWTRSMITAVTSVSQRHEEISAANDFSQVWVGVEQHMMKITLSTSAQSTILAL